MEQWETSKQKIDRPSSEEYEEKWAYTYKNIKHKDDVKILTKN